MLVQIDVLIRHGVKHDKLKHTIFDYVTFQIQIILKGIILHKYFVFEIYCETISNKLFHYSKLIDLENF